MRKFVIAVFVLNVNYGATAAQLIDKGQPRFRGPVAIGFLSDGRTACVANQKSGTVSLVDLDQRRVVAETPVGEAPSDLVVCSSDDLVLVSDAKRNRVVALSYQDGQLIQHESVPVARHPVRLAASADGRQVFVSCLWSRRVSQLEIERDADVLHVSPIREISLPFAPRELLVLESPNKLVVADSFGGQIAVVDIRTGVVESVREIAGHNLRGLTLNANGDRVLVSQQVLNPLAPTTRDNIIWSVLMTNCVRGVSVAHLLDPDAEIMQDSRFIPLGTVGRGAGDPADLAVDATGRMLVCLAGVHQLAVVSPDGYREERLSTGRRPIRIAPQPSGRGYLVVNHFSDSLTWIPPAALAETTARTEQTDADGYTVKPIVAHDDIVEIRLGSTPELTDAQAGEQLFYDATLSHDKWMSCHSCHTDGHTNGGQADTLGDGDYGAPKQIMSLLGVSHTGPWAWNGSVEQLREQIRMSIQTSMQGRQPSASQLDALQGFLETLAPPPPPDPTTDQTVVSRGHGLFLERDCQQCHDGDQFTSELTFDVGLKDEAGRTQFNPPSLLGVGQRDHLLHDGRANSLRDLLGDKFRHPAESPLLPDEIETLVRYLRSL